MKSLKTLVLLLGVLTLLAACGPTQAAAPAPASPAAPVAGKTPSASGALLVTSTTAVEETEAVQNQILAAMPSSQVSAIASMHLTNATLQAYYVEIGVATAATPEPGVTPQSGSFKDLPPEQREAAKATAQALGTPVGNGSSAKKDVLLDTVIQLLTARAANLRNQTGQTYAPQYLSQAA